MHRHAPTAYSRPSSLAHHALAGRRLRRRYRPSQDHRQGPTAVKSGTKARLVVTIANTARFTRASKPRAVSVRYKRKTYVLRHVAGTASRQRRRRRDQPGGRASLSTRPTD